MEKNKKTYEQKSFEKAFERLEEILSLLNEGKITLNDSLKLFEEADSLITNCHSNLSNAEQKIEKLIKNRNDLLELDENSEPKKENFTTVVEGILEKDVPISK
jgi:exodeoxyribonuclease VII small subunit